MSKSRAFLSLTALTVSLALMFTAPVAVFADAIHDSQFTMHNEELDEPSSSEASDSGEGTTASITTEAETTSETKSTEGESSDPVETSSEDDASDASEASTDSSSEDVSTKDPSESSPTEPAATDPTEPTVIAAALEGIMPLAEEVGSWNCGPGGSASVKATLNDEGLFTITGEGPMDDYEYVFDGWVMTTTALWASAFGKIKEVRIEGGVTSVGAFSFRQCENLTSVTIPEGVTEIGDGAFILSLGLRSITFPASLETIGASAFANATALSEITFQGSIPPAIDPEGAFGYINGNGMVIFPDGAEDAYSGILSNMYLDSGSWKAAVDAPDLAVSITADQDVCYVGDTITYTVTVENIGYAVAEGVQIRTLSMLLGIEYSMGGEDNWSDFIGYLYLPDMASGDSSEIKIRGIITDQNNFGVTASTASGDANLDNNLATAETTVLPAAPATTLIVSNNADKAAYLPGEIITYTIGIQNMGEAEINGLEIADTVPEGVLNPEYSTDSGSTWQAWTGSVTLPLGVDSDGMITLQIRGTVSDTATGSLANSATITSDVLDLDTGEPINMTVSTLNNPVVTPTADLSATMTADKKTYYPGDEITYTIRVTNNGPATAEGITVVGFVPDSVENPRYSTDGGSDWLSWNNALHQQEIANGASFTLLIRGTVSDTAAAGDSLAGSALIGSTTPRPDGSANVAAASTAASPLGDPVVAEASADLSATITADETAGDPGDVINYTITVTNNGPAKAKAPVLTDAIPPQAESPEYSSDGGATWQPWNGSLILYDVPSGDSVTTRIRGVIADGATAPISNTVSVLALTPDPKPDNNSATAVVNVNTAPTITGPTELTLTEGYAEISTGAYTFGGSPYPGVAASGDAKITWNAATKALDIAVGLTKGTYPVTLTASNGIGDDATHIFTLTVEPKPGQPAEKPARPARRLSSGNSGGRDPAPYGRPTAPAEAWMTAANLENPSRGALPFGVRAPVWSMLGGSYSHDSIRGNAVEVRTYFDDPGLLTRDSYVSGWTTGADVNKIRATFEKWFANKVRAIHFDRTGLWEHPIRVAARVDLAGMDTAKLVIYAYDPKTNTYRKLAAPAYWVDANGYLRFTTEYAGEIVIAGGELEKR